MSMVPALAEQHAAHKARMARLAGMAPPLPRFTPPPQRHVALPPVVDLCGPRKHQIALLAAAGYSQARIAKRLGLTTGVVAGVIHRARAQQHRLLMVDAIGILFGLGFDTYEIGGMVGEPEHVVANALARWRERQR